MIWIRIHVTFVIRTYLLLPMLYVIHVLNVILSFVFIVMPRKTQRTLRTDKYPSSTCEYCFHSDSLIHFLINYEKIKAFWESWATLWLNITGYNIVNNEFPIECLLFGFPGNSSNARFIIFCTLYAKYFIYTHKIKGNNNFKFLGYLTYLKHVLMIEENICITKHQEISFVPLNIVLDSL